MFNKSFSLPGKITDIYEVALKSQKALTQGETVYTRTGQPISLQEEVLSNSQSITYKSSCTGMFVKIYQPQWLTTSYFEDKLKLMVGKPLQYEGICWPTELVYNKSGDFVGFLVPKAEGFQLKQIMSQQGLEQCFPDWDRKNLTRLVQTILDKLSFLHEHNVLFGIINFASIFVKNEQEVFLTEMDTYQIEGYPILFHEQVLQAPEFQFTEEQLQLYSKQHDYYGVALLTFMLLMPGKFPYNKGNNATLHNSIQNMEFAFRYGKNKEEHGAREHFGLWRFVWSHLGSELKSAFYSVFNREQEYSLPENRPNTKFWLKKVSNLVQELDDPYDKESLKIFPRTFKRYHGTRTIRCKQCGIDHPAFYFRYPEKQICNSCLGKPSSTHFICKSCGKPYFYDFGTLFKYETLIEKKNFKMPTHCPYCRADKDRCISCGKIVPSYRLNASGMCIDCSSQITERYACVCGKEIKLTRGEVDYHMGKFGHLPRFCAHCRANRKR